MIDSKELTAPSPCVAARRQDSPGLIAPLCSRRKGQTTRPASALTSVQARSRAAVAGGRLVEIAEWQATVAVPHLQPPSYVSLSPSGWLGGQRASGGGPLDPAGPWVCGTPGAHWQGWELGLAGAALASLPLSALAKTVVESQQSQAAQNEGRAYERWPSCLSSLPEVQ
ncbi:hypothetical protein JX265_009711 [Neoarthrinium moseri]|uniref:Uncharacterized protein n=1 Tax=Neoarthrinium moseri TaxID=1658444 RepID=A0A9Q0AJ14_9PEZI|nr:hypothetical protein JX265_009711 [Neoarthrinium moseri]